MADTVTGKGAGSVLSIIKGMNQEVKNFSVLKDKVEKELSDLEKQIDDAYNYGKRDENVNSFFSFSGAGKMLAFGVLGYLGLTALMNKHNKQGSKTK